MKGSIKTYSKSYTSEVKKNNDWTLKFDYLNRYSIQHVWLYWSLSMSLTSFSLKDACKRLLQASFNEKLVNDNENFRLSESAKEAKAT